MSSAGLGAGMIWGGADIERKSNSPGFSVEGRVALGFGEKLTEIGFRSLSH